MCILAVTEVVHSRREKKRSSSSQMQGSLLLLRTLTEGDDAGLSVDGRRISVHLNLVVDLEADFDVWCIVRREHPCSAADSRVRSHMRVYNLAVACVLIEMISDVQYERQPAHRNDHHDMIGANNEMSQNRTSCSGKRGTTARTHLHPVESDCDDSRSMQVDVHHAPVCAYVNGWTR